MACETSGRGAGEVRLVAVTKNVPLGLVEAAFTAGVVDFGENRAVELARKADEWRVRGATWHFLGKLQRGTVRHVARHADVVHSAEPGVALEELARRASAAGRVIPVLLEVDFTGHRVGVDPEDSLDAADRLSCLDGVALRGLMTVAPLTGDPGGARRVFRQLAALGHRLAERFPDALELSMGMSADYAIAIEEGATMVRVGTAIFGERPGTRA